MVVVVVVLSHLSPLQMEKGDKGSTLTRMGVSG